MITLFAGKFDGVSASAAAGAAVHEIVHMLFAMLGRLREQFGDAATDRFLATDPWRQLDMRPFAAQSDALAAALDDLLKVLRLQVTTAELTRSLVAEAFAYTMGREFSRAIEAADAAHKPGPKVVIDAVSVADILVRAYVLERSSVPETALADPAVAKAVRRLAPAIEALTDAIRGPGHAALGSAPAHEGVTALRFASKRRIGATSLRRAQNRRPRATEAVAPGSQKKDFCQRAAMPSMRRGTASCRAGRGARGTGPICIPGRGGTPAAAGRAAGGWTSATAGGWTTAGAGGWTTAAAGGWATATGRAFTSRPVAAPYWSMITSMSRWMRGLRYSDWAASVPLKSPCSIAIIRNDAGCDSRNSACNSRVCLDPDPLADLGEPQLGARRFGPEVDDDGRVEHHREMQPRHEADSAKFFAREVAVQTARRERVVE